MIMLVCESSYIKHNRAEQSQANIDRKKKYDSRTHQGFGKLQGMVKSCKNYRPPASVKQMQKKEKKLSQSVKI